MVKVFWWSKCRMNGGKLENFGDFLVPFLLQHLTPQKFKWFNPTKKKFLFNQKKHIFCIGSILHFATKNSIVWGSGIISLQEHVEEADFRAVRGPLTRKKLLEKGYNVPAKYGDPALLLSLFKEEFCGEKKFRYGIVPHFVDYEEALQFFNQDFDVKVINVLTDDPRVVINQILQCEYILSSSLHGIIVSHAMGVPALWLKISNRLYGDDVKFYDYYQSLNLEEPAIVNEIPRSIIEMENLFIKYKVEAIPGKEKIDILIKNLIETFPLEKTLNFEKVIKKYFGEVDTNVG